ncbi:MAG: hypothetical protein U1F54_16080 [Burkholderiales bacterium]
MSIAVCLLVGEFAARRFLNPADYLSVEMVDDEILGATPKTGSVSQFDKWGFRNPDVPVSTDIVAIGDSHTFGNAATMEDAWPSILARLSGQRVYNLGMGGYGPNQYFYLLVNKGLKLHPKKIVVGFYMGDDFENAYLITYGLDYWKALRARPDDRVDIDTWQTQESPSWHRRIRIWLSQNSVLYQIVFHASLIGRAKGELQIRNARSISDTVTTLEIPERHILEAFSPNLVARNLDQSSEAIREGMRITFRLLADMNEVSRKNGALLVVAVIPTKELVFANYLKGDPQIPLGQVIGDLVNNEMLAREKMFAFLKQENIAYVDLLPSLRAAAEKGLYATSASDMHPARNGYKVIAEKIFEDLKGRD